MTEQVSPPQQTETHWWIYRLALLSAVVYFFSNDNHYVPYDYTFRIAKALFQGQLGLSSKPPGWLNEFVPWNGKYYSVFPLGSVISQVPVTWLAQLSGISRYPSALVVAAVGALTSVFTFLLAGCYRVSTAQRVALALFVRSGGRSVLPAPSWSIRGALELRINRWPRMVMSTEAPRAEKGPKSKEIGVKITS